MTTILAISDTHFHAGNIPENVVELAKKADFVVGIFTSKGDYDALTKALTGGYKGEVWAVYGDLDPKDLSAIQPIKDTKEPLPEKDYRVIDNVGVYLANKLEFINRDFSESKAMEIANTLEAGLPVNPTTGVKGKINLLIFGLIDQPTVVWCKHPVAVDNVYKSRLLLSPGSSSIATIDRRSYRSVAMLEISGGDINSVELIRIAPTYQNGWRRCSKCQGLFYGLLKVVENECPAGGVHKDSEVYYSLAHNDPMAPGKANWRWCNKCQGLFFPSNPDKSKCPAGGRHDSRGSGDYTLNPNTLGDAEPNWRLCSMCQGLFFAGSKNNMGVCPGVSNKGTHVIGDKSNYRIEVEWKK
jgi:predicted phosphodiesterase